LNRDTARRRAPGGVTEPEGTELTLG
jgi:hypothetical protein